MTHSCLYSRVFDAFSDLHQLLHVYGTHTLGAHTHIQTKCLKQNNERKEVVQCPQLGTVLLVSCLNEMVPPQLLSPVQRLSPLCFLSNTLFSLVTGAAAENVLGSLLCLPGSGSVLLDPCTGSTISETTSEAWSVEVLPSDSG